MSIDNETTEPTLATIEEALGRIGRYVHRTPVLRSKSMNKLFNRELFFKAENLQKTGSFKARGASNLIWQLSDEELEHGVVTHSSGNHAQGVAYAANCRGVSARIVMPETAPQVKVDAVRGYGADISFCEPNAKAREEATRQIHEESGAYIVHPYNDYRIISGQGTVGLEFALQTEALDALIVPIGGGGLSSGCSLAFKAMSPSTKIFGVEPDAYADAKASLDGDKLVAPGAPAAKTIADGLVMPLGEKPFGILRQHLDGVTTVSDKEIVAAMKLVYERMKIVIEPSSATVIAALSCADISKDYKRVGLVLSGGNVDITNFPWSSYL